jgi:hypothetical protein
MFAISVFSKSVVISDSDSELEMIRITNFTRGHNLGELKCKEIFELLENTEDGFTNAEIGRTL